MKTPEQWANELTEVVDKGTGRKYDWPDFEIIVRRVRESALHEAAEALKEHKPIEYAYGKYRNCGCEGCEQVRHDRDAILSLIDRKEKL